MSAVSNAFVAQLNGRPASAEALAPIAFAGFAHFTAMQVRGRKIRGLDLHLERLRSASMTLFGRAVSDDEWEALRPKLDSTQRHNLYDTPHPWKISAPPRG